MHTTAMGLNGILKVLRHYLVKKKVKMSPNTSLNMKEENNKILLKILIISFQTADKTH